MKGRTLKEDKQGFTLVELIVVIAILAILAAVAYPVYTGYITKANEAADQVLLGAVNESFRSALYDVGYNDGELPAEANASLMHKKVSAVTSTGIDGLNDAFFKYFEGNQNKEFKVVEGLLYNQAQGFYASLNGGNKILFGGGNSLVNKGTNAEGYTEWEWNKDGKTYTIKTSKEELSKYANSTYGKNMTFGSLMDEVNNVASSAADILKISNNGAFYGMIEKAVKPYLDKAGIEKSSVTDGEYNNALANALVLGVAGVISDYATDDDPNTVDALYKVAMGTKFNVDNRRMDMGLGAAAVYAVDYTVMTGYANSEVGRTAKVNDPDNSGSQITLQEYYNKMSQKLSTAGSQAEAKQILTNIGATLRGTDEFQPYMEAHGREDIEGMVAAMNSIKNNSDTLARSGVLTSGFADDGVKDVLSAIFGG